MALAKINTEKIVVRGERCRRIVGWENILSENTLPHQYTQDRVDGRWPKGNAPFFSAYESQLFFYGPMEALKGAPLRNVNEGLACSSITIWKGGELPEATFQELLTWLRRSGARLGKINRRLAKENADWHGEEAVEI